MSNYEENLEKYKRMQKKAQTPEYDPTPVVRDRFLGKPLMFVMILMAILLIMAVTSGVYQSLDETLSAIAVTACCLVLTYYGYKMNLASRFYKDSRRWLRNPGTISTRQLATNTRRTEADVYKLTKDMIRRKYYRNLTISEDKKKITIAPIEDPKAKPQA